MSLVAVPTAATKYGGSFLGAPVADSNESQLPVVAGPAVDDATPFFHPDHPLFWLGAILAGAVGLAYFSTTVRVGPVEGSASLGKK